MLNICMSTLVGCYLRVYGLYSHHPRLGPKLVMIQSMLIELQMFIFILVVVLVSYGVSQQVLLYPYRNNFSWTALVDIFYYPYWNLYGELMLEYAFAQKEGCTSDGVLGTECPMFNYLSPLFLAVYLMIAGILLINLLIAIFSNVFEKLKKIH
uniref:SJCHGC08092 protein n=1 Tax=Schistosoma japonicum TaxID=6182 RepID=Q5DB82_SCHJA|nr:SJCHGC08092 protein [Schistosoma japonicum]